MSDTIENLKIVVNNEPSAAQMDESETNFLDLNADESEKMIVTDTNNDETEFHVNLDKVPITLKQTLIVRLVIIKIMNYSNEYSTNCMLIMIKERETLL
jgi:hypothetical protein